MICKRCMHSILSIILLILIFPPVVQGAGLLEIHFIDVGQGDAILIKAPANTNVLIDTGNLSAGHRVKKYLKDQQVYALNALIITHMHPDHVGGLFCLVPDLGVEKIYDNGAVIPGYDFWKEYVNLVRELGLDRQIVKAGARICFGDLVFDVISPWDPLLGDLNADSLVIRVQYGKMAFLMTGDLNKKGERRLLGKGVDLQSHVLKVGHHGSCKASSAAFLKEVNPRIAVISVGKDNERGYPCDETIQVIRKKGVRLYRTDRDGTVVIRTDGEKIWDQ